MFTKKVNWLNVLAILVIVIVVVGFWCFWIYSAFLFNPGETAVSSGSKEEINLNIEVVESGGVVDKNDNVITLIAPAEYKVVRAAYGEDCWYNLTNSATYGSGEDLIMMNTAGENTYRISCQPLIGNGKITSVSKTVIVVSPAELSSAGSVSLSR